MRVLIADDHGIVRSGLRKLLERQAGIEVVAEAADGVEARDSAIARAARPGDPRRLDAELTGLAGDARDPQQAPEVAVLILSMHDDERYLFEALKAGASGYVLKRAGRPRPRRRDPGGRARRAVPDPGRPAGADPRRPRRGDEPRRGAHPARGGGRQAGRRGAHEQGDRRDPPPLREDRRDPPRERAAEARHARPRRARPLRDPPRPDRAVGAIPVPAAQAGLRRLSRSW